MHEVDVVALPSLAILRITAPLPGAWPARQLACMSGICMQCIMSCMAHAACAGLASWRCRARSRPLQAQVHEATVSAGAYPSPLNYFNFPKSVCTSVNEARAALPSMHPMLHTHHMIVGVLESADQCAQIIQRTL